MGEGGVMSYLITDWMNNVCFNTNENMFKTFDDAHDFLVEQIFKLTDGNEKDFDEEIGEYEVSHFCDRYNKLEYQGGRLVLMGGE